MAAATIGGSMLLSGCNGDDDDGGPVVPTPTAAATGTAAPTPGGTGVAFSGQQLFVSGQPAQDPGTGRALRFIIVDLSRSGSSGGSGTFEEPYGALSVALTNARSGDIVYVRASNDASRLTDGFTVPAGVRVLSSGPAQSIKIRQRADEVTLPGSGSNRLPKVTGTVTLGRGSGVSGFDITAAGGSGIEAANTSGSILVTNNVVRGSGPGGSGISIASSTGTADVTITGNTVSGAANSGIQIRSDGSARITASLSRNTSTRNTGSGIFLFLNNGQVSARIAGNTTNENRARSPQEAGIRFGVFNAARGTVTLENNTSQSNMGNGIFVGTQGTSQATCTATGNRALNNTGNGIFLGANENGVANGTISNNTSTGNKVNAAFDPFPTGAGIFVGSQVNGRTSVDVTGNTSSNNGNIGVFFFVAQNGRGTANITRNTVGGNTRNGIEVNAGLNGAPGNPPGASDAPQAGAVIENNTVSGNLGIGPPLGGGGVFVLGFNRATVRVAARNNRILNNATSSGAFGGMAVVAVQRAQIFAGVVGNRFSGNRGANPAFTAASGVPPTVLGGALAGPARIALRLSNNVSDSSYALLRVPNTTFNAAFTGNSGGPVVQPALPVDPLGNILVPGDPGSP